jgi:hypothetical protein
MFKVKQSKFFSIRAVSVEERERERERERLSIYSRAF